MQAMNSVKTIRSQAAETAARKRDLLRTEFLEIKALIEEKENQTPKVVMEEEKRVCNKFDYIYKILGNKKNEIQSLTEQIEMALTEGDDILFLKRAAALQRTSIKEAFVPVIEMNHDMIHAAYQSAINLKDVVKLAVNVPMDKRTDGTVSLWELAFCASALSSNERDSPSNPNIRINVKIKIPVAITAQSINQSGGETYTSYLLYGLTKLIFLNSSALLEFFLHTG